MENKNWRGNQTNKIKASLEETKFIYDQAEKKLKEIVLSGDLVVSRTTTLIAIIVGLLVALIGFATNRYFTTCMLDVPTYTSIVSIIYLLISLGYISLNIKGTQYSIMGASPKTLFSNSFFTTTENANLREKMFVWAQIENYQDMIDSNQQTNIVRWCRFDKSVKLVLVTPVFIMVTFFILRLFL